MREEKFVRESIKMDLYRVITASGDVSKPISADLVSVFMLHALRDFEKYSLNKSETELFDKLKYLISQISNLGRKKDRLKWVEDVMTVRSRL